MTPPSDKTIRAAVLRWTKAELRWAEYALSRGGQQFLGEAQGRLRDKQAAVTNLLRIGNRMLVATAKHEVRQWP